MITVVRNGAAHIEECISSVLGQDYPNIEYIVIDGGSTDGTLPIIEKYKHRIAVLVSEPDEGISDAFNKGLRLATGEITGLLNADDWLEPGAITRIVRESSDCDVIYGDLRQWNSNQSQYILRSDHRVLGLRMSLNHPSVYVKNEVYKKIGYYNMRYRLAMDYEFLLRCFRSGMRFRYCDAVITNMRTDGASDRKWLAALKEVRRAKNEQLGKKPAHYLSFLMARFRTWASKQLLSSRLEPLFSIYRKKSKNTIRQS